jgi:hypothetical protein
MLAMVLLSSFLSTFSYAGSGEDHLPFELELGLQRCEDKFIDGEMQNCTRAAPLTRTLRFDLGRNCSADTHGKKTCADTSMHEIRFESGKATAFVVVSSEEKPAEKKSFSLTIMLIPGWNPLQQTRLSLELKDNGELPAAIDLAAASFISETDKHIYIPSLKLR